ncbi:unnamed protein product [Heligmosomoides polygyrus]|uniref:Neur_chan_LBD domain-containing protein n=1 Tax=Heligmosomoides polygyrus TaxID=6339 RepID=A0A3P7YP77_HELPZ|nr:unnamed protein product [Heligmosomoides polygyrus]
MDDLVILGTNALELFGMKLGPLKSAEVLCATKPVEVVMKERVFIPPHSAKVVTVASAVQPGEYVMLSKDPGIAPDHFLIGGEEDDPLHDDSAVPEGLVVSEGYDSSGDDREDDDEDNAEIELGYAFADPTTPGIRDIMQLEVYDGKDPTNLQINVVRSPLCEARLINILTVSMKIFLQQLLNVDEQNQVIEVNAWLKYIWNDYRLRWRPTLHDNISSLRFLSDEQQIWIPDILLYNSANENFDSTYRSNLVVYSNGEINWIPPGIFKISCKMDITMFPFDEQVGNSEH